MAVPALCCGDKVNYDPLDEGCSITCVPLRDSHDHKTLLVRVFSPFSEGCYQPTVHYDCIENQMKSIRNRVCGVVPKPTPQGLASLKRNLLQITKHIRPTDEVDVYDLSLRNVGAKRKKYELAADRYVNYGVRRGDASIKMFVKAEKFNLAKKVNPDPRAIQFRGAVYCVALSKFLHPIEQQLYLFKHASAGVPRSRNVAKGMNAVDRAHAVVEKLKGFNDPVMIGLDASRFDKHVNKLVLILEHLIYLSSNNNPEFRRLLKMQLNSKCFTNTGFKYRVEGRRMSGDMNTAIGNVVIMLLMVITCMETLGIKKWDCLDDGDDCVLFVERDCVPCIEANLGDVFLTYGFVMKVERPVSSAFEVEFCQSKICEYAPGQYKFVRDWKAVTSKAASGVRNWRDPAFRSRIIHAIGTCELVLNLGVPVLQSFALALLRNSVGVDDVFKYAPRNLGARVKRDLKHLGVKEKDIYKIDPSPILACARASFAMAWGVSESEQRSLEARFDSLTFPLSGLTYHPTETTTITWESMQTIEELYDLWH